MLFTMSVPRQPVRLRAWVVVFAGTAVNLCLGILYAWSVWKANLIATSGHPAGSAMSGLDAGWTYLTDAEGTWAYAVCGITFALFMIPGGRVQDKFGPKIGASLGGLFLAAGCILAGLMKTYWGLIAGFGVLGGIGMGLGYAATTPAAVKWFGPHQRGLVVGLVVGGYGGSGHLHLAAGQISDRQLRHFRQLHRPGDFFRNRDDRGRQLLSWPPAGYYRRLPRRAADATWARQSVMTQVAWPVSAMLRTWQFYAMVFLFIGSAQSGLLVIVNATPMLNSMAKTVAFLAANTWLLASYGGLINAAGRVGTGLYSDKIGRTNAYLINGTVAAACLFLTPAIMQSGSVVLLFLAVGLAYWQYGGGLSLMPAMTADFFGTQDLGIKYGLVFLGWGIAFLVPQIAGYIKDLTGSLDNAFYLSGCLMVMAVILSRLVHRPLAPTATPAVRGLV